MKRSGDAIHSFGRALGVDLIAGIAHARVMAALPRLGPNDETLLHVAGEMLVPLPEGALWWPEARLLVVSDLHLEKGSSFAARGQMLPPHDTPATLSVVESLVSRLGPQTLVSLGDSFHDVGAEARLNEENADRLRALTASTDWIWVEGNHDPAPPAHLGGRAAALLRVGRLVFRHEPQGEAGEIAGHLHPCARVRGRGRSVRRRCFATDGSRLVMPAMGAFTGGLNVLDRAFARVFPQGLLAFAMGDDRVYTLSKSSLLPDKPAGGAGVWRL